VLLGLAVAALYTAIAVIVSLLSAGASIESRGLSLGSVIVVYVVGGVLGGVMFAVFAPLGATRFGSAVVGTLIMLPVSVGAVLFHPQASLGDSDTWAAIVTCAVIMGGGVAYSIWEPERSDS